VRRSDFVPRQRTARQGLYSICHVTCSLISLSTITSRLVVGEANAQKAAKDAFVTEARSWLEPLQKMLAAEQGRLLSLENRTADDFLLVVAIKRQLGALKRYLKISTDDARHYQTMRVKPFEPARKPRPREFVVLVGEFRRFWTAARYALPLIAAAAERRD
jgi:hypothetical protein